MWQVWVQKLHRWGVRDFAGAMLESMGFLSLIGAQFIYLVQPMVRDTLVEGHLDALAEMLEDPIQTRDFTNFLKEGAGILQ